MKRAFAMVLAVTLFFSFAVIGYAALPVGASSFSVRASASTYALADTESYIPVVGNVSFLEYASELGDSEVETYVGNNWPDIGTFSNYTFPVNSQRRQNFYFTAQNRVFVALGGNQYKIRFIANVPLEPSGYQFEYYADLGSTISRVTITDYSATWENGILVFDGNFVLPGDAVLRTFSILTDGILSSAVSGSVSQFSMFNFGVPPTASDEWQSGQYSGAVNPDLAPKIEEAYSAAETVDTFEQDMWSELDRYSADVNPDNFTFDPQFISSMGWIASTWTDCFNGLGSWQSIITFPMFLGLAMLIIGRGSQAIDRGVAKHERAQRREIRARTDYKRHEELMDKLG